MHSNFAYKSIHTEKAHSERYILENILKVYVYPITSSFNTNTYSTYIVLQFLLFLHHIICCGYMRVKKIMNFSNILFKREIKYHWNNISWHRAQTFLNYCVQQLCCLVGCEVYHLKLLFTKQLGKIKSFPTTQLFVLKKLSIQSMTKMANRLISVFIK